MFVRTGRPEAWRMVQNIYVCMDVRARASKQPREKERERDF